MCVCVCLRDVRGVFGALFALGCIVAHNCSVQSTRASLATAAAVVGVQAESIKNGLARACVKEVLNKKKKKTVAYGARGDGDFGVARLDPKY